MQSWTALSVVQELLEFSLSAPGRVAVPRAPPHSLLLYGSLFSPFPAGWGLETPLVSKYTGDRLQLREGGQQLREEFRRKVCLVYATDCGMVSIWLTLTNKWIHSSAHYAWHDCLLSCSAVSAGRGFGPLW